MNFEKMIKYIETKIGNLEKKPDFEYQSGKLYGMVSIMQYGISGNNKGDHDKLNLLRKLMNKLLDTTDMIEAL